MIILRIHTSANSFNSNGSNDTTNRPEMAQDTLFWQMTDVTLPLLA
jgi:hypothetical protein